ncbi:MAG: glycosyltransferase [Bacteroidota bacterium]|nr:glycosyltransferase [Bacteroidota bacterium]
MAKNVLYISYDGLCDPLGQSQILPYLIGLSEKGHKISIISYEKPSKYKINKTYIQQVVSENNITWYPHRYTRFPPIISTIFNVYFLLEKIKQLFKYQHFDIVHCRSYIAAFGGELAQKNYNAKFIFDMRGFWADERIEGGLWNIRNFVFKSIYTFFKHKELQWLSKADIVVTLTHSAKKYLVEKQLVNEKKTFVIPCMVDTQLFNYQKVNLDSIVLIKKTLNIDKDAYVLGYVGSVSTWYLLDEMIDFYKIVLSKIPNAFFLLVSTENEFIEHKMKIHSIDSQHFRCIGASRNQVPGLISLFDLGICLIKNSFSKIASSPVKLGEMMAMGIPVVCNANIGDINMISEKYNSVYTLQSLDNESYEKAINLVLRNSIQKHDIINSAIEFFSLQNGIEVYQNIYENG